MSSIHYLIALAASEPQLVTGDAHLLARQETIPVLSPRDALESLG